MSDNTREIVISKIFTNTKSKAGLEFSSPLIRIYFDTPDGEKNASAFVENDSTATKWKQGDQALETVQRRTLHMRTNQLLSARVHTPFDAATSRIYGNQITADAKFITLDHAILPLDSE